MSLGSSLEPEQQEEGNERLRPLAYSRHLTACHLDSLTEIAEVGSICHNCNHLPLACSASGRLDDSHLIMIFTVHLSPRHLT
jgi:hypothetical protein